VDALHERLARVGLAALADYGFALAGGYAVQAHGILDRPSEDVDLFTTLAAEHRFPDAVRAAVASYQAGGLTVDVIVENSGFARLAVTDTATARRPRSNSGSTGGSTHRPHSRSGLSWPATTPSRTRSTPCTPEARSATTSTSIYAQALRAVRRLPATEFAAYGLADEQTHRLVTDVLAWADDIDRDA
jgi:hypothetical protein